MRRRPVLLLTAVAVATASLPLSTASAVVDSVAPQAGSVSAQADPASTPDGPAGTASGPASPASTPDGPAGTASGPASPASTPDGPAGVQARPANGPAGPALAPDGPAGTAAVRMRFDAGPEPVAKGATITLGGRVWRAARGNKARVDFYFRAGGTPADAFTYQGFATTSDAGNFSRSYPALTTGTWKAVFAGSASRRNAARLDAVQVFQRRSREIAGWSAQSHSWRSPTIRIPTKDYKALVSWTCAGTGSPFIHLTWTGEGGGAEYVHGTKPAGTLTLNGHAGARRGFFKVSSAADCAWKVRVFSGVGSFQV